MKFFLVRDYKWSLSYLSTNSHALASESLWIVIIYYDYFIEIIVKSIYIINKYYFVKILFYIVNTFCTDRILYYFHVWFIQVCNDAQSTALSKAD